MMYPPDPQAWCLLFNDGKSLGERLVTLRSFFYLRSERNELLELPPPEYILYIRFEFTLATTRSL